MSLLSEVESWHTRWTVLFHRSVYAVLFFDCFRFFDTFDCEFTPNSLGSCWQFVDLQCVGEKNAPDCMTHKYHHSPSGGGWLLRDLMEFDYVLRCWSYPVFTCARPMHVRVFSNKVKTAAHDAWGWRANMWAFDMPATKRPGNARDEECLVFFVCPRDKNNNLAATKAATRTYFPPRLCANNARNWSFQVLSQSRLKQNRKKTKIKNTAKQNKTTTKQPAGAAAIRTA